MGWLNSNWVLKLANPTGSHGGIDSAHFSKSPIRALISSKRYHTNYRHGKSVMFIILYGYQIHFRTSKQLNENNRFKTVFKIGLVGHLNTVTWEFLESGHTLSRFIVPFQFYLYSLYYSIDHTPKSIKISDHN